MMSVEEQIKVLTAYKEGCQIQIQCNVNDGTTDPCPWSDCTAPTWNFHDYNYRIKPVSDTKVLDVTNIKQFFEVYIGDKVADANNVLKEILSVLTCNSLDYLTQWIADNTQCLQTAGWMKQSDISASLIKEEFSDTYEEILSDGFDVDQLNDDQLHEATARWMNNSGYEDIVNMIKEEA